MSESNEPIEPKAEDATAPEEEPKAEGELSEGELSEDELEGTTGGAGKVIAPAVKPQVSIKKIDQKIGPTAPLFDPNKVMHSPNNST